MSRLVGAVSLLLAATLPVYGQTARILEWLTRNKAEIAKEVVKKIGETLLDKTLVDSVWEGITGEVTPDEVLARLERLERATQVQTGVLSTQIVGLKKQVAAGLTRAEYEAAVKDMLQGMEVLLQLRDERVDRLEDRVGALEDRVSELERGKRTAAVSPPLERNDLLEILRRLDALETAQAPRVSAPRPAPAVPARPIPQRPAPPPSNAPPQSLSWVVRQPPTAAPGPVGFDLGHLPTRRGSGLRCQVAGALDPGASATRRLIVDLRARADRKVALQDVHATLQLPGRPPVVGPTRDAAAVPVLAESRLTPDAWVDAVRVGAEVPASDAWRLLVLVRVDEEWCVGAVAPAGAGDLPAGLLWLADGFPHLGGRQLTAHGRVRSDGTLEGIEFLGLDPRHRETVMAAVRRWVFAPATNGGRAVDGQWSATLAIR